MTARFALLHPSTVRTLLDLSNPAKSVGLPLVKGKAAGPLELIYQLFPPRNIHRHQIAPTYTFPLEGWVTHELPIMVSMVAERDDGSEDLILGFIEHDHWSELTDKAGIDTPDARSHYVAVKCNLTTREGHIYLYKDAYKVIEASHKDEIENMRGIKADETPAFSNQTEEPNKPQRGKKKKPVAPTTQKGAARILYAEDGKVLRRSVTESLIRHGYTVDAVEDGQQLFDKLEAAAKSGRQYDLVITDNDMPVVTGLRALRYIREKRKALFTHEFGGEERFTDLPVIVLSGSPEIKGAVEKLGGIFLDKMGDVEEFYETIGRLTEKAGKKTS